MYFLLTSDGQRIAVHAYGPREAEESVVMLHGWWMNHRVFEAAVGSLLYKKKRVLLPDLRGFGGSAGAEAGVFLARMALDVYELVKLENLRNITFVGHGGRSAISAAVFRVPCAPGGDDLGGRDLPGGGTCVRCLVLAGERGSGDLVLPGDVGAAAQPGAHAVGGTGRLWCVRHRRGGRLGCWAK